MGKSLVSCFFETQCILRGTGVWGRGNDWPPNAAEIRRDNAITVAEDGRRIERKTTAPRTCAHSENCHRGHLPHYNPSTKLCCLVQPQLLR